MDEGRCVSRMEAIQTLEDAKRHMPSGYINAYVAAFNRARYELLKGEPVKPITNLNGSWSCGYCGRRMGKEDNYCKNCGREIDKS